MNPCKVTRIAILGGEGCEWMVAAALKTFLGEMVSIVVLNGKQQFLSAPVSSVQSLKKFHDTLGIDEKHFMQSTGASFKLGSCYRHWSTPESEFTQSLNAHGFSLDGHEFHHYLQRLHAAGDRICIGDFSLSAQAGIRGNFGRKSSNNDLISSSLEYAFHFDEGVYYNYFKEHYSHLEIAQCSGEILSIINSDNGDVVSVQLDNGNTLTADFWLDCSGNINSPFSNHVDNQYQSWMDFLPIDRVMRLAYPKQMNPSPLTYLAWMPEGWIREVHLQDKTVLEFFYKSNHSSDDEILQKLSTFRGDPIAQPTTQDLHIGARELCWKNNCVFMGTAAGGLGELTIPRLHLLQSAILRFINLFPTSKNYFCLAEEFNRITQAEYIHIRDFHQLHFLLARRPEKSYWDSCFPSMMSDLLEYKMHLFKRLGKVAFYEDETCSAGVWTAFFLGMDYWPENADVLVSSQPIEDVRRKITQLKNVLAQTAKNLPSHRYYLEQLNAG